MREGGGPATARAGRGDPPATEAAAGPEARAAAAAAGLAAARLTLLHLYPDLLNIYGDRGNVVALARRAAWRGIALDVREASVGEAVDWEAVDLVTIGGGEDTKQGLAAEDLAARADGLRAAIEGGLAVLAVCGGYQLLGHYYEPAEGPRLPGVGALDAHTKAGRRRMIGNVVADAPDLGSLVGFENHSGRTFLGPGCRPLARVRRGRGGGNNGSDGGEGARHRHCVGTYLHGSVLPKNPALADFLLGGALERRYGARAAEAALRPLPDDLEARAHRAAEALAHDGGR